VAVAADDEQGGTVSFGDKHRAGRPACNAAPHGDLSRLRGLPDCRRLDLGELALDRACCSALGGTGSPVTVASHLFAETGCQQRIACTRPPVFPACTSAQGNAV
jgi:hypothetical protein